jgi:hypothetical protein
MSGGQNKKPEGQGGSGLGADVDHLTRRAIQAPIAACLIRAFAEEMGREKALEIAGRAIQSDAMQGGRAVADMYGDNSLKTLARVVREIWAAGDALTVRFIEETDQRLYFDVTRCRYAEMYEKLGMRDLGFCLSCCRDGSFGEGFNPRIRLARTQTIMEGAGFCDFRFAMV